MFEIKICGITSVEDALTVVEAGADAVGLNFYPKSPRYIRPELAGRIAAVLPPEVVKVGHSSGSPWTWSNSTGMSRRSIWPSWASFP